MNKKQLYYALGGKKTRKALAKAEQEFLDTLPYDDGIAFNRGKVKKYDFAGWLDSNKGSITTGLSAANALLDGFKSIDSLKSYEDIKNQRADYNQAAMSNISDNNALMNAFNNISWANEDDYTNKMFGAPRWEDAISEGITAGVNGVMATKSPWGLLAAVPSVGMNIFKGIRGKKQADIAKADVDNVNSSLARQFSTVANNVDMKNDRLALQAMMNDPFFALGGETRTHGSDFTNGLTFINEGGSHEENPNEGVQVGVDEEGTPNLVEEGESIWNNDYVFSKRLKVPTEISTKYKLGGDMSFADAVEKLTRESRVRPNDPISNATNNIILAELRDSQEQIRGKIQQEAAQKYVEAYNQDALLQSLAGMNGIMAPQEGGIDMQMPQQGQEMLPPGMAFGGNLFYNGGNTKEIDDLLEEIQKYSKHRSYKYYYDRVNKAKSEAQNKALIAARNVSSNPDSSAYKSKYAEVYEKELSKAVKEGREAKRQLSPHQSVAEKAEAKRADAYLERQEKEYGTEASRQKAAEQLKALGYDVDRVTIDNMYSIYNSLAKEHQKEFLNTIRESSKRDAAKTKAEKQNVGENDAEPKGPAKTTDSPDLPDPKVVAQRKAAAEEYKKAAGDKFSQTKYNDIASGKIAYTPSKPSSGQAGQGNPDWIPYDKKINGKEYEAKEDYQNFIKYMDSIKGTKEAQDWIDHINEEIAKTGSKRRIKDFDDWRQLALDGKVGPVHEYTIKAAAEFKQNVDKRKAESPKLEAPTNLKEVPTGATAEKTPEIQFPESNYSGDKVTYDQPTEEENGLHPATVASGVQSLIDTFTTPDFSNADAVIDEARKIGTPINIPVETIGNYRRRNPFDEKYLVNMANANRAAALRSMDNTTGGNQGARLANVLNYFNQRDLGEVAKQAYLANRADDAQVAEFNRGTDLQNMAAINQRNATQAQLNSHRQQAAFNGIAHGYSMRQNIQDRWDQNSGLTQSTFIQNLENEDKNKEILRWMNFLNDNIYRTDLYGKSEKGNPHQTVQPAIVKAALQSQPQVKVQPQTTTPVVSIYDRPGEFNYNEWLEGLQNGTIAPEEGIPVSSTKTPKVGETPFADTDDYDTWIKQLQEGVKKFGGKKKSKKRRF